MTPRSFARTPSTVAEDAGETPVTDLGSGDESLPPHTSEIGTLKKLPNHGTAWLGSSSGVYFVNTVRRAFSTALLKANASNIPASEDILTGEDAEGRNYNGPVAEAGQSVTEGDFRKVVLASLGHPPADRGLAMELVTTFFRCWHPLFPFMHGPRFLKDIEKIYAMPDVKATNKFTAIESRRIATFQLIINIASLDRSDIHLPVESRIKSTSDVTRVAGCFSIDHDIPAIQLLIAAELYLVATISLRQASTVAGMILKLIYHAGLHRCPLRYAQLSIEDCDIRRRVFWSAYALDRHLSLSLGDPNTVQDNDIDVCLSGRELHKAVASEFIINPNDELKMHLPRPQAGPTGSGSPLDDPQVVDLNSGPQAREKTQREAAMAAYVHYGKLTGRIIEIFHKSIHARFQKPEAIVFLNSDIENWWNDLPSSLTSDGSLEDGPLQPSDPSADPSATPNPPPASTTPSSATSTTQRQLAPFFSVLYNQLLLLLSRPRLSLDQSTAEFQHGLQICIKASRNTLTALKKHRDNGQSMLLPGLLSAAWMAGLIIAFACQLGKYPKNRAVSDIGSCLVVLESMGCSQWFTVKNCHKVLSLLLANIRSRRAGRDGFLNTQQPGVGSGGLPAPLRKRTIDTDAPGSGIPSKRINAGAATSPTSPTGEFRIPSKRPTTSSKLSSSTQRQQQKSALNHSANNTASGRAVPEWQDSSSPSSPLSQPAQSGSALYANPRDITLAQSTHSLPLPGIESDFTDQPFSDTIDHNSNSKNDTSTSSDVNDPFLTMDDPLFWGNFDFNISDVFGAASWEHMMPDLGGNGNGTGNGTGGWGDIFGNAMGGGGVL